MCDEWDFWKNHDSQKQIERAFKTNSHKLEPKGSESNYDDTTLIINHIVDIARACNEIFYNLITCALMCVSSNFKNQIQQSWLIDKISFQNLISHVNSVNSKQKQDIELYDFHFFLGPFDINAFTFNTTQSFKPMSV